MLNLILLLIVAYALARTWDDVRGKIRESRQRRLARREQQAAPAQLTPRQRRATTLRHDTGWWAREALSGFPSTLHGFQAGWLSHSAQAQQQKAERDEHRRARDSWRARRRNASVPGDPQPQAAAAPQPAAPGPPEHQPGAAAPPGVTTVPDPDPEGGPVPAQTQGEPVPATTTSRPAEMTYDQCIAESGKQISAGEIRLAQLRAQAALQMAESIAPAIRDENTLGRIADVHDSLEAEIKAVQKSVESWTAFRDGLRHDHGGMARAHQDAPVRGADPSFYEG